MADHSHLPSQMVKVILLDIPSINQNLSSHRRVYPHQELHQCTFTGARFPNDSYFVVDTNFEIKVIENKCLSLWILECHFPELNLPFNICSHTPSHLFGQLLLILALQDIEEKCPCSPGLRDIRNMLTVLSDSIGSIDNRKDGDEDHMTTVIDDTLLKQYRGNPED